MIFFNKKYRYFKEKIESIEKMIFDYEFKKYKNRVSREHVRDEYDQLKSRFAALEQRIKSEKEKPSLPEGDAARLDDDKVRIEKEIEKKKQQLDVLDQEVNGIKPSADYPEGVMGINEQIEMLRTLKHLVKEYIK